MASETLMFETGRIASADHSLANALDQLDEALDADVEARCTRLPPEPIDLPENPTAADVLPIVGATRARLFRYLAKSMPGAGLKHGRPVALDKLGPPSQANLATRAGAWIENGIGEALGQIALTSDLARLDVPENPHNGAKTRGQRFPFFSAVDVLRWGIYGDPSRGRCSIGYAPIQLHAAQNVARTRPNDYEIHSTGQRGGYPLTKGLTLVERIADAARGLASANIDPLDLAGLVDWLLNDEERLARAQTYRLRAAALELGIGEPDEVFPDLAPAVRSNARLIVRATEMRVTTLSDEAIWRRTKAAKKALEVHLASLPQPLIPRPAHMEPRKPKDPNAEPRPQRKTDPDLLVPITLGLDMPLQ